MEDFKVDLEYEPIECAVYESYSPKRITIGVPHPTPLVEGTSLASVSPPMVSYQLLMPDRLYKMVSGTQPHLSNAQLEAIIYACQSFQQFFTVDEQSYRTGFFLGDGCGVGKTRSLAGIAYELWLQGKRKIVWFGPQPDLINTVIAELEVFDSTINVAMLSKCKLGFEGIVFCTYSALHSTGDQPESAYQWLQKFLVDSKFDGAIIFDESHFGKNASDAKSPSQSGKFMVELQVNYPLAHIVYSSATCASESFHLSCMQRLRLWGDGTNYKDEKEFALEMGKLGIGALELMSMDMKRRGVFVSRVISIKDVKVTVLSSDWLTDHDEVYERCSTIWTIMLMHTYARMDSVPPEDRRGVMSNFCSAALSFFGSLIFSYKLRTAAARIQQDLKNGKSIILGIQSTGEKSFEQWSKKSFNQERPFSVLAEILKRQLGACGIAVGCPKLYHKGASTYSKIGDWTERNELNEMTEQLKASPPDPNEPDFDVEFEEEEEEEEEAASSTYRALVDSLKGRKILRVIRAGLKVDRSYRELAKFPPYCVGAYGVIDDGGREIRRPNQMTWSADKAMESLSADWIARLFHELVPLLPINPLDELIDRVKTVHPGKESNAKNLISNGTGRQYYYTVDDNGLWHKQGTDKKEREITRFMEKKTRVILVSNAASVGVSLHPRAGMPNQEPRSHYTLQFPYAPDKLAQQLGRSLRAEQLHSPQYFLVLSKVPAEARFESVVARRLEQQGSICQGQSQSGILSGTLSDAMCSILAVQAINLTVSELSKKDSTLRAYLKFLGIRNGSLRNLTSKKIEKFTSYTYNRVMMCSVDVQRLIFQSISKNVEQLAEGGMKQYGPILEYPHPRFNFKANLLESRMFELEDGPVYLQKFIISRILYWKEIEEIVRKLDKLGDSFYTSKRYGVFFAPKPVDGIYKVFFPFSKDAVTMPWKFIPIDCETEVAMIAKHRWITITEKLELASCYCSTIGQCHAQGCKRNLGCHFLNLLSGNAFKFLHYVATENEDLQLARVNYIANNENAVDIGMVIPELRVEDIQNSLGYQSKKYKAKSRVTKRSEKAKSAKVPTDSNSGSCDDGSKSGPMQKRRKL